jgi:Fur family transcriptional regulator, ferric uptake regulator
MPQREERRGARAAAESGIARRIAEAFAATGGRDTHPRRLIAQQLASLAASGADFTAQDLWHDVRGIDPHVGRATVFRAVDTLLAEGVLDRVPFANGTHRYRLCGSAHHHHITCSRCQRVVEVDACLPAALLAAITSETDFAIEGHTIELFGTCAACRQAERDAHPSMT